MVNLIHDFCVVPPFLRKVVLLSVTSLILLGNSFLLYRGRSRGR